MKPKIGELWDVCDEVKVSVGNKIATYLISGPGLVVGFNGNDDDEYEVLWGNDIQKFLISNFCEKIQ